VLPYINNVSKHIGAAFNKSKVILGYKCFNRLNKIIKVHKDLVTRDANSNIIYKIVCNNCVASYVGQTKRQLKTRVKEHINDFKKTSSQLSVISKHRLDFNHTFNWDNTQILDFEPNFYKRLISETIHIKEQTHGLNLINDTDLLDHSYFNLLNELRSVKF